MNYRHAFHAGNHADCLKHALLLALLRALSRKPAGFAVLDAHAGRGAYDLSAPEALRTGEVDRGAARLTPTPVLDDYLALIADAGFPEHYPGSPALVRAVLRPQDRLACCELHPEDHAALRVLFARDCQVAVHKRDGWEALGALLPFPEKRGLVLLDPPFEREGEFTRMTEGIALINRRMRGAIIAAWYPIKHRAPVRAFHHALRETGVRDILDCALMLREPTDPQRLNGSALVVVNPPFGFEAEAQSILAALLDALGDGEPGQGVAVTRVVEE
ncbi:MAG: 23S rRNA (adenine(2030)-N(6))-methyltransferase RlmJ [Pseudomonadota bacterium]